MLQALSTQQTWRMGEPAAAPPPVVWDTHRYEPRDRIALTREVGRGLPTPVELTSPDPDRFRLRVETGQLGPMSLIRNQGVGASVTRDERMSRRADRARLIVGVAEGDGASDAGVGEPTEILLYSSIRSYVSRLDGIRRTFVSVDYEELRLPQRVIEARLHEPIDARSGIPNVVATFLLAAADLRLDDTADDAEPLARPTVELVRTLLTVTAGDESLARGPMRATLAERIMRFMESALGDPDLNVGTVARAHHISERYVYAILQEQGIVFGDWVRAKRLHECAQLLADPRAERVTISEIAFRWGFRDHSTFTRAFHRAYGMSPTEWRARSR